MAEVTAQDAGFDVATAIEAFLKDDSKKSLELPTGLTADQRKQAKKLADVHGSIKCESYGFGAERKLHLFKQDGLGTVSEASPIGRLQEAWSPVRVKNTFIDDFMTTEAKEGEGVHMRTMPDRLGGPVFLKQDEPLQLASVPGTADSPTSPLQVPAPAQRPPPFASTSTTLYSEDNWAAGPPMGEATSVPPSVPDGFRFTVRDTFIHIENEAEQPIPERVSQTMPPGLSFQQCLEAELRERSKNSSMAPTPPPAVAPPPKPSPPPMLATPGTSSSAAAAQAAAAQAAAAQAAAIAAAAAAAPSATAATSTAPTLTTTPPPAPAGETTFHPGTEVVIEGLLKLPAFNGRTGTVDSLDAETGRYNVLLDDPSGTGAKWAKVKGDNLRLKLQPPPSFAPTLAGDSECYDPCMWMGAGMASVTPSWEDHQYGLSAGGLSTMGGLSTTPLKLDGLL